MSTWPGLMEAMASTLEAAYEGVQYDGRDIGVQVYPRLVVNPSPPCIDIYPGDVPRETDTAGFSVSGIDGGVFFTVRARVSTADTDAGQELLIAFMDDADELSLAVALMEDQTLGGLANDVTVEQQTGFVEYPMGEGSLLGCQWRAWVLPNPLAST